MASVEENGLRYDGSDVARLREAAGAEREELTSRDVVGEGRGMRRRARRGTSLSVAYSSRSSSRRAGDGSTKNLRSSHRDGERER